MAGLAVWEIVFKIFCYTIIAFAKLYNKNPIFSDLWKFAVVKFWKKLKMEFLLQYINFIFNPIRTVDYINNYFHQIEQIILYKRKDLILKIKLINLVLFLKGLHYVYIGFEDSLNYIERILVLFVWF